MLDISKLISISESAGAAVQIQEPVIECPEEYKNLSMSESSLYFENQMLKCELEYRDIMDESVNTMVQDMLDRQNGIVNEAAIIDKAKQLIERVWEAIKKIIKWIAKAFTTICARAKALFSKKKEIDNKASKAIDDANSKYNAKKNSPKNESAGDLNEEAQTISTIDPDELAKKHSFIDSVKIDDDAVSLKVFYPVIYYLSPDELMKVIKSNIYGLFTEFSDLDKLCKYRSNNDAIEDFYKELHYRLHHNFAPRRDGYVKEQTNKESCNKLCNIIKNVKLCDGNDTTNKTTIDIEFRYGKTRFTNIIDLLKDIYGDGWCKDGTGVTFAQFNNDYDKWSDEFSSMFTKCMDTAEKRLKEIINSENESLIPVAVQRFPLISEFGHACSEAAYSVFHGEINYFQAMTTLLPILSTIYCKTLYAKM